MKTNSLLLQKLVIIVCSFAFSISLSPTLRGEGEVGPSTNGNTAEGTGALNSLPPRSPGTNNTALGYQTLYNDTSASNNTAVGSQALFNDLSSAIPDTYGNTAGVNNTATGSHALFANTTGVNNTADGFQALNSNTIGFANTATGFAALSSNTTGHNNTGIGRGALGSNTTATDNSAIGYNSLGNHVTGDNNIALGSYTLFNDTSGNDNTAIGYAALYNNTTTSTPDAYGDTTGQGTAVGYQAMFSNTTGQGTAVGYQALFSNTFGVDNCALGFQALYSNTGGTDNTAVGFQALLSASTSGNDVAIGSGALVSETTGLRNVAVGTGTLGNEDGGDSNTGIGGAALASGGAINFNTAVGRRALYRSNGNQNIALGFFAGSNLRSSGANNVYVGNVGPNSLGSESNTIRIGTESATTATIGNPPIETHTMPAHTATYIAGVYGNATSDAGSTTPVVIDMNGKLGTTASSERFKHDIQPMDKASETLLSLKPVTFHYKNDKKDTQQFGLVAEEVAKVNPNLVVRDAKGEIYTVRYDAVNAMLLNEFLKEHQKVEQLEAKESDQSKQIADLKDELRKQAAAIQAVNDRVEINKAAPQTVAIGR